MFHAHLLRWCAEAAVQQVKLRGALGVLFLFAQHLVAVDPLGIEKLLAAPMWYEVQGDEP